MKSALLMSLTLSSLLLLQGCILDGNGSSAYSGSDNSSSLVNTASEVSSSAKNVQISWKAPDTRLNNEPLESAEIESYEIVYKQQGETIGSSIIAEGAATEAVITLEPGVTYEVVIAAVDKNGFIGPASAPIEVKI